MPHPRHCGPSSPLSSPYRSAVTRTGYGTSKTFATEPTQWMTLIPTIYNADTLGISSVRSHATPHPAPTATSSTHEPSSR